MVWKIAGWDKATVGPLDPAYYTPVPDGTGDPISDVLCPDCWTHHGAGYNPARVQSVNTLPRDVEGCSYCGKGNS